MHIRHLALTNFRNWRQLEFEPPQGISVFQGANAQGKTNLLEAVYFLATTRFSRSVAEREIIHREMLSDPLGFAHLSADIERQDRNVHLDINLMPRTASGGDGISQMQKRIRVNGIPRRASDLIGQLNMVMFSPRDIDLVTGEPAFRRRYLDITNSQVDPVYLKALQRYQRVLARRNHLLRQIAMREAHPDELDFWNRELVSAGAYIILRREQMLTKLNQLADPINRKLSGEREHLELRYKKKGIDSDISEASSIEDVEAAYKKALASVYEKELLRGVTLIGPHRDDMGFWVNGMDMGPYGSRGQQRTIALSLKMAEVGFILSETSEVPVLLLDDVCSELDHERREHLLEAVSGYGQVMITATDIDRFPTDFMDGAHLFSVEDATIK